MTNGKLKNDIHTSLFFHIRYGYIDFVLVVGVVLFFFVFF